MSTKAEKVHLNRVASLGCIVCKNLGYEDTPAQIHHIRTGKGRAQRASHYETLPLCPMHHQHGGHGVALHAGQKTWEQNYGTELELLAQVRAELGIETGVTA
ncbi:Ref family recombination enhancement nuclease [Serratia liquefaciens]|uniref:Ref family recombination enhancement nuclease n=1 Tax=Serratia liquefaciens TaxID=614 RepID=UPI003B42ED41